MGKTVVTSENDDKDRWTEAFTRVTGDHVQRSRIRNRRGRFAEQLPREDDTCAPPIAIGRFRRLGKPEAQEGIGSGIAACGVSFAGRHSASELGQQPSFANATQGSLSSNLAFGGLLA